MMTRGVTARAYRALSVAMTNQGLSREATRFQYRAEVMGRRATFHDYNWLRWVASLALDLFAGYGIYQIWRLLLTYLGVIFIFTGVYLYIGHIAGPAIDFPTALVLSFTSFHGRGLQPSSTLSAGMQYAAVVEAVFGVLVEALLVAALVRRITGD